MPVKKHADYPNFHTVDHPLLQHKLSHLRETRTDTKSFKELITEITLLLAYEATKNLQLTTHTITTPLETCSAPLIAGRKPVILPILRAGISMVDAFLTLMPSARVGHIGLYRDETTLQPQFYYFKIPDNSLDRAYFVCDPMLATGGSAVEAMKRLYAEGVKQITFVCIVAAPEGVAHLSKHCPDIPIYCAGLDRGLDENGFIRPGLGDAGDRCFGTK